ncbi:MAG TPA: DNA-binding protein WhiA [Gaiellaceae bacterium]|nr:DNA-binding protein WhiA [Gaiellaceae bacterium]
MSLSDALREELAAIDPRGECDRLAELSGLFHTAGSVHLRGRGELALHLDLAASAVARRAFALLRSFGVESEIRTYRRRAFERGTRYQLHVPGDEPALAVLRDAGVLDEALAPLPLPPPRVVARACCRGAYVRGALLGAGSLTGPPALHLEIRQSAAAGARLLAELAPLAVADRGRHAVAYAKGRGAVEDTLALAGAAGLVLGLEEGAVMGETRARANRLANADHANLVRTSRAAHLQLRAVRRLADRGELDGLPGPLREAAELRLKHPAASLAELARRCDPPATKASLHRRLRRVVELSEM